LKFFQDGGGRHLGAAILDIFKPEIAPFRSAVPENPTLETTDDRLRRYGHMAAAAILDFFELKITPLDPPSPITPP